MPSPRKSVSERFWPKVDKDGPVPAHCPELGPCWIWTFATNEHGYGVMSPGGKGGGPTLKAHRVSAQLAGMDIDGKKVRHRCDNPPCVNPAHLLTGTQADNLRDMRERGRGNIGQVNGQAKLTDEQVLAIRAELANGVPGKSLAAKYGVGQPVISTIKNARQWRHLATEPVEVPKVSREVAVSCACGCGEEFTTPDKWGNKREWVKGHYRRSRAA